MVDHSAVGRRSKRKGKTYERRTAKLLSEATGVGFRKTPGSGGFNKQGGVQIRDEMFCGDVICDQPDFAFCVESKNRKTFSFTGILKNPDTAAFTSWWYQCCQDAGEVGLLPILFFKPDNQADFIAVDKRGMDQLGLWMDDHFTLSLYEDKLLTFKVKDRWSKKTEEIECELPVPYILNWKVVKESVEQDCWFRSNEDGMLRQKQSKS